jgi:uncharacterized membrane protein YkvA (DUF1232 family)
MYLEAWKRRARQLSAQTYALYLAYRAPRTPWYAKVFAALVVGYVFSPIDPIPDWIPAVGLLDEMVVVPIGVLVAAKMIPPSGHGGVPGEGPRSGPRRCELLTVGIAVIRAL